MKNRAKEILTYFALILVSLSFFFWGLVQAKSFLAPLSVAGLLAMVVLPVARWFESKGIKRGWASLLADVVILLFFVLFAGIISLQVKSFVQDWPKIKDRIEPKISNLQQFVEEQTGITAQEQQQMLSNKIPGGASGSNNQGQAGVQSQQQGSSMLSSAGGYVASLVSFLGTFLLTFVYIFFFLLYRRKFRKSIIKMAPEEKSDSVHEIITKSATISQNYLFGRLILIIILAVLYSIGLFLSGVQNAVLISILASVLTLIPYIGNIIGYSLAVGMAFFSGSGLAGAIGVTATFAITQFVESYILEPYIVGNKVNLNPVFTIIVVVLGGALWGIIGMLIAIPALGIVKAVFDNIPVLSALGYLFGDEDIGDDDENEDSFFKKIKHWAMNKFNSRQKS
ncbi:AI-2E family transporter [Pontibacter silvestris]|uniref:AI-2E family transporter n=1 Tax=Pontibacter silvestris TaxID=2305183 RepID=A0ABW4WVP4_9BACT|nr:AI-2E family transporter [Pontibacter silvestris]MCC9136934.1 AI-2E family transporter [Pontibacter silvestris]